MSHGLLLALNQRGLAPLLPPPGNGLAPRIRSEKSEAETLLASPLLLSRSEIDLHHWELSKTNNSPHPRPKGTGVLSVLLTSIKGPDPLRIMMVATQIQHRHVLICCTRESPIPPQAPPGPLGALFNHYRQQYHRIAQYANTTSTSAEASHSPLALRGANAASTSLESIDAGSQIEANTASIGTEANHSPAREAIIVYPNNPRTGPITTDKAIVWNANTTPQMATILVGDAMTEHVKLAKTENLCLSNTSVEELSSEIQKNPQQ